MNAATNASTGDYYLNAYGSYTVPNYYYSPNVYASGTIRASDLTIPKPEAPARPESDLDWLKRRVREICWEPK